MGRKAKLAVVIMFPKIEGCKEFVLEEGNDELREEPAGHSSIQDQEQITELENMIQTKFPDSVGFQGLVFGEAMQYCIPVVVMKFMEKISLSCLMKACDEYGKNRGYKLEIEVVNPKLGAQEIWDYIMAKDSLKAGSV